jgi:hypothetical protein
MGPAMTALAVVELGDVFLTPPPAFLFLSKKFQYILEELILHNKLHNRWLFPEVKDGHVCFIFSA